MNNKSTILIVEDENRISSFMNTILSVNNYHVITATTGKEALALVTSYCPDAMLLDLGLPDMDGIQLIKTIREWSQIPIIVVSARDHERDKVEALDLGADDYVSKPFGTSELLARIRTALRHAQTRLDHNMAPNGCFVCQGLTIDYDKRHIYVDGIDVHLTQIEYKIVALLSKYAGRVLTYDYIIKTLWGPHAKYDNQILRVNMANIRRKIEKNPAEPQYIFTEVGVGYRMIEGN